jgi:signal transduction histidine kinase
MSADGPRPGADGPRPGGPSRGRRSSLRLRYAMMASLFAAVTFVASGAFAITRYHDSLVSAVDNSVRATANALADQARKAPLPDPIPMPVASGVPRVQVLNGAGQVISGDPASVRDPPLLALARAQSQQVVSVSQPASLPERRAAVVAVRASSRAGPVTIIVAASLDPADTETNQALELSALLGALSVTVVGVVAWLTAGRTLRRVELMRAQVEAITASGDPGRRVTDAGTDELARLSSTLNEMLAAMSRSSERQRRFVADAAHELRTPLAGLSTSLEVAISHPETAADGSWVAELADGHRRLGRLVNDLLVLAGLDGDAPRHRQPVDLAGVVTDGTRRLTPPGVELVSGRIEHAVVSGDESQLTRVVTNLVDNALRHARSTVQVALASEDDAAVITVADDGPGIPAADRDRIWDRFVRLDTDRGRASGGSGLGLALVKELVAEHDGTVSVTDHREGTGAIFVVRLPLTGVAPASRAHDSTTLAVSGRDADEGPAASVNVPGSVTHPAPDQYWKARSGIRT